MCVRARVHRWDGRMRGCVDGWVGGCVGRWMDGRTDGSACVREWMGSWVCEWMDGRTNGRKDRKWNGMRWWNGQ